MSPKNENIRTKNKPVGIASNEVPSIVIKLASPVRGKTVTHKISQTKHMQMCILMFLPMVDSLLTFYFGLTYAPEPTKERQKWALAVNPLNKLLHLRAVPPF